MAHRLAHAGQEKLGIFCGHFPGAQHPLPPAGHHHEQGASPMLPGSVYMHRPAAIGHQHRFELFRTSTVKPTQILDETLGKVTDFTG